MSKWNSSQICSFLDIYEQYELLWNTRLNDYTNKGKREIAFGKLIAETEKELGTFTVDQMRKKIKAIKTVYRNELMKVIKSKKSGASPDEIYIPKLAWFKRADSFLNDVTASRQSTSNLVLQANTNSQFHDDATEDTQGSDVEEIEIDLGNTNPHEQISHIIPNRNIANNVKKQQLTTFETTPKARTTGLKRKADSNIDVVKEAVTSLKQIVATNNAQVVEDEFTAYSKHIAAQLRELPLISALRLQDKIQSLITQERISCLSGTNMHDTRLVKDTVTEAHASSADTSRPSTSFSHVSYSDCNEDAVYYNM